MKQLDDILKFYLSSNTNFALMITGEWGIGKTYYYKNNLQPIISSTSVYSNESKRYRPVHISLFGLNSIKEVQTEILYSLYPIFKNRIVKVGLSAGKNVFKFFAKKYDASDAVDAVLKTEVDKNDWIDNEELVICFDDLERISKSLSVQDLIGYINSLVESDNIKVLIIANETKISEENYRLFKEKVVGNSIEFLPDIETSFQNLVNLQFSSFYLYKTFLYENVNLIKEVYFSKTQNFRTLTFALTYFQRIFSIIKDGISREKLMVSYEKELLINLFKFSLAISIEYKKGTISYLNKNKLDGVGFDIDAFRSRSNNNNTSNEKSFRQSFIETYYSGDRFHYYTAVYDFITGGSIPSDTEIFRDLKKYYNIKDGEISPQESVFTKLSYPNVYKLNTKEYATLTRQLLKYAEMGQYGLGVYVSIFHFITRFNNPLKIDISTIESRLIKGMNKGVLKYEYFPMLEYYISLQEDSTPEQYRIRDVAISINESIQIRNNVARSKELEKLYEDNFELFTIKLRGDKEGLDYMPVFHNFSPSKFYSFILKSDNYVRIEITRLLKRRYVHGTENLKSECSFLSALRTRLENKRSDYPIGIDRVTFTSLYDVINEAILKMQK